MAWRSSAAPQELATVASELPPWGLDQRDLGGGAGLEFVHIFDEEIQKAVRGFLFEDYGLGKKAVAEAVARGILLSVFGDGASGAGSVGSGGLDLFRCHKINRPQINTDERRSNRRILARD